MEKINISQNIELKISTPNCSCSSPCPIHKTETIKLDQNLQQIYSSDKSHTEQQ